MVCLVALISLLKSIQRMTGRGLFKAKLHDFIYKRDDEKTIAEARNVEHDGPVYWFHAASLGEYSVIRPIMERMKRQAECRIVLTFFSVTGYNALLSQQPQQRIADYVWLLPMDTKSRARRFVDALNPDAMVVSVSDIWPNSIFEIDRHGIPAYLFSATIRSNSIYFKAWGAMHRKALRTFRKVFVLDEASLGRLDKLGITTGVKTGSVLYNNAIAVAETAYSDTLIEHFCQSAKGGVCIAGSINDDHDLAMMAYLANHNSDRKFIFVPHEIGRSELQKMQAAINAQSVLHSECASLLSKCDPQHSGSDAAEPDFSDVQVLIIDFVGALSKIYRYGKMAYIGGGFTPFLHNVIEATVYGLPVAFGPNTRRQPTAESARSAGVGTVVSSSEELNAWYRSLMSDGEQYAALREKAIRFTRDNVEDLDRIVAEIGQGSDENK